jgi:hypothetical protein
MLLKRAPAPVAVSSEETGRPSGVSSELTPAPLLKSAAEPTAVLKFASVLLRSESKPIAVLCMPVVTLKRAFCPSAVLLTGREPGGSGVSGGLTACAIGQNAKQTISSKVTNQPRNDGAWVIGFLRFAFKHEIVLRVIIFMMPGFSRCSQFFEIRRIAYECYCPIPTLSVKAERRCTLWHSPINAL